MPHQGPPPPAVHPPRNPSATEALPPVGYFPNGAFSPFCPSIRRVVCPSFPEKNLPPDAKCSPPEAICPNPQPPHDDASRGRRLASKLPHARNANPNLKIPRTVATPASRNYPAPTSRGRWGGRGANAAAVTAPRIRGPGCGWSAQAPIAPWALSESFLKDDGPVRPSLWGGGPPVYGKEGPPRQCQKRFRSAPLVYLGKTDAGPRNCQAPHPAFFPLVEKKRFPKQGESRRVPYPPTGRFHIPLLAPVLTILGPPGSV